MMNFGIEVDEFNFDSWYKESEKLKQDKITEGIFAPWCMYKEDFLSIGGHDELFAPQSKEDSDLFNRFLLNGYKFIQSWDALVYHFTSRGSRFNKHSGGGAGKNSEEWIQTTTKNGRNFIRKWGHFIKHDSLMKPIIPSKYSIGIILEGNNIELLKVLEPWCDNIYADPNMIQDYIQVEQMNTSMNLYERVLPIDNEKNNEILIKVDSSKFTQQDFSYIQQLAEILDNDKQLRDEQFPCDFQLGNLFININNLNTYQHELIKL